MTPTLVFLQGAAIAASLFHVFIDIWLALFGSAPAMTPGQALTLMSVAAIYGWWPAALFAASTGMRGGMLGLAILSGAWALLAQGLVGLAFCLPPCSGAPPWGDVAHITSVASGAAAAWTAWRAYRAMPGATERRFPVTAVVLLLLAFGLGAANVTMPTP